tara:strand:- start:237 stop:416 length:180 start_codon:yes stop_codon:yes gene_type:complete
MPHNTHIQDIMEFLTSLLIAVFIGLLMVIITGFIPVGYMAIAFIIMFIIPLIIEKLRQR